MRHGDEKYVYSFPSILIFRDDEYLGRVEGAKRFRDIEYEIEEVIESNV